MAISNEVFRIYDTTTNSYFTTGKKSTWGTKAAAISAAKEEFSKTVAPTRAYSWVKHKIYPVGYLEASIEIHIFPLSNAVKVPYVTALTDYNKKKR